MEIAGGRAEPVSADMGTRSEPRAGTGMLARVPVGVDDGGLTDGLDLSNRLVVGGEPQAEPDGPLCVVDDPLVAGHPEEGVGEVLEGQDVELELVEVPVGREVACDLGRAQV